MVQRLKDFLSLGINQDRNLNFKPGYYGQGCIKIISEEIVKTSVIDTGHGLPFILLDAGVAKQRADKI